MKRTDIIDLKMLVKNGELYYPPYSEEKLEAQIRTGLKSNHAANMLELKNGDILCVWFAGSDEGCNDIKIYMSRLNKGSAIWSPCQRVSEDYRKSEQNPMLFLDTDGRIWLFYTSQNTRNMTPEEYNTYHAANSKPGECFTMQETSQIRYRISENNGYTWGPVKIFNDMPGAFCRHPMVILSNGEWILPMFYSVFDGKTCLGADYSVVRISGDKWKTWEEYTVPNSKGRVHMCILEIENSKLLAFFRSRAADRIYLSNSEDYGRTWTPVERTDMPNINASFQVIKLDSGNLAMIYNDVCLNDDPNVVMWPESMRHYITIAISGDNGATWPYKRRIDAVDYFCGEENRHLNPKDEYPCIIQTRDGLIHAAYSYHAREYIKYACGSEKWVKGVERI